MKDIYNVTGLCYIGWLGVVLLPSLRLVRIIGVQRDHLRGRSGLFDSSSVESSSMWITDVHRVIQNVESRNPSGNSWRIVVLSSVIRVVDWVLTAKGLLVFLLCCAITFWHCGKNHFELVQHLGPCCNWSFASNAWKVPGFLCWLCWSEERRWFGGVPLGTGNDWFKRYWMYGVWNL